MSDIDSDRAQLDGVDLHDEIQHLGEVIKAVQKFCQKQLAETGQCTCNGCQAHRAILKLIDLKLCSSTE